MKKLALAWYTLLFYPVIAIILNMIYGSDAGAGHYFTASGISLAVSFAGYFTRFFCYQAEHSKGRLVFAFEMIPVLVVTVIMSVLHQDMNIVLYIYMFAVYFIGAKIYDMELRGIVSSSYVIVSSIFYLGASISMKLNDNEAVYGLLIPYGAALLVWLFLSNSKNINVMMSTRNYDEKYLPPEMRAYNRRHTAVICAVMTFVLLFYKMMAKLVSYAVYLLGQLLIMIFSFLETPQEAVHDNPIVERAQNARRDADTFNPYADILQLLLFVIIAGVCIWLVILGIKNGIFTKILRSMVMTIRRIFERKKMNDDDLKDTGYTDVVENITGEEDSVKLSKRKKYRNWNEQYKKYLSMNDGVEKFRFGYYLVSLWIRITDPGTSLSRTPYELAERINEKSVDKITEEYYPIRYGKREYNINNIHTADDALRDLKNEIRRNRKGAKK